MAPARIPTRVMPIWIEGETVGLGREFESRARLGVSLVGPLLEAGLSGRYQGDFTQDKHPVEKDEEENQ